MEPLEGSGWADASQSVIRSRTGLGEWERWSSGAMRLMYSPRYMFVYAALGIVCVAMFAWSLSVQYLTSAYIAVDFVVNLFLTAEVMVRLIGLGTKVSCSQ